LDDARARIGEAARAVRCSDGLLEADDEQPVEVAARGGLRIHEWCARHSRRVLMRGRTSRSVALGLLIALGASVASAADAPAVHVPAILSLTGAGAFLGSAEAHTLAVAQQYVNAHGGVRGRPVSFDVLDDQTVPQTTVQLASRLAAEKVAVAIG